MSLIPTPDEAAMPDLYWMAIAAAVFGFFMAFGIGANDVGNCFATTVAAKSLTLIQAVFVAAIFEFLGAALLGASVTKTIRSGILDMDMYEGEQEVLAFGMLVALVNASFWLILATAYGLPVSTTHTIIAAIIGFSLAAKGWDSVKWVSCSKIFISWVVAPAITGLIGFLLFLVVKKGVLKSEHPFNRAAMSYSLVIFGTLSINIFFVMHKGLKKLKLDTWLKLVISFGVAAFIAIVFQFFIVGWLKARIIRSEQEYEAATETNEAAALEEGSDEDDLKKNKDEKINSDTSISTPDEESSDAPTTTEKTSTKIRKFLKNIADRTYNRDLETEAMSMDDDAADIWGKAEVYDAKSEVLYSYLQVFTACALSFAHGSNDVANAVAPICAVLAIYESGALSAKAPVPRWVLVMGAFGIIIGLALFGYKVIISIGYRLTKLSPSRGFAIQLSTSFVVVIASYLGIPVSTTQSTIGGTIGVGVVEGVGGVQWMFMMNVFLGWVGTFFITCITSAGIMAFCYYSPSSGAFSSMVDATNSTAA